MKSYKQKQKQLKLNEINNYFNVCLQQFLTQCESFKMFKYFAANGNYFELT